MRSGPTIRSRATKRCCDHILGNCGCTHAQEAKEGAGAPPYALMEAPPLALFANGVAAAFNELRHCAPLVLRRPATQVVQVRGTPTLHPPPGLICARGPFTCVMIFRRPGVSCISFQAQSAYSVRTR